MNIAERSVEAVKYGNLNLMSVYVKQKQGDCPKQDESYKCADNCKGNIVVARFLNKERLSVRTVFPAKFEQTSLKGNIESISDMEEAAKKEGYELTSGQFTAVLYYDLSQIASYTSCHLDIGSYDLGFEKKSIVDELTRRLGEIYRIASKKPLDDILQDPELVVDLKRKNMLPILSTMFGTDGPRLVKLLKSRD